MSLPTPPTLPGASDPTRPGADAPAPRGATAAARPARAWRLAGALSLPLLALLLPAAAQKSAPVQVEVQMQTQVQGQKSGPVQAPIALPVPVTVTVPVPATKGGPVQMQLPAQLQIQFPGAASAPTPITATAASAAPPAAGLPAPGAASPSAASPPPAPATPAPPAAAAGPPSPRPAAQPAVQAAAASPVEFTPAELPVARVGVRYGPLPLVRNGAGAIVFDLGGDITASGLEVSSAAVLQGVPKQVGDYRFTVTLVGAAGVATPLRQAFRLRVLPPRGARTAPTVAAAASAPPPPVLVPKSMTEALPALSDTPHGRSWKITADDLKALAEATTQAIAKKEEQQDDFPGQAPSDAAVATGTRVQTNLANLLAPMLDVEYPTRELFDAALTARQRIACLKLMNEQAKKLRQEPDAGACGRTSPVEFLPSAAVSPSLKTTQPPPRAGDTSTRAPADAQDKDLLTAAQTMDAVLPRAQREDLLRLAERSHGLAAAQPVRWTGGACGCVDPRSENFIYGFMPFWTPVEDKVLEVDFSGYTRIGYLGALLGEDGSISRSPHWNDQHRDGLRTALRHGTGLDLVVYGRRWEALLARSDSARDDAVRRAAQELMQMVNTPLGGWPVTLQKLALPGWPRATHLYSGITLFFDEAPEVPDDRKAAEHQRLLADFITALVNEMRRGNREYALNVVVPAARLGADGQVRTMDSVRRLLERTGSVTAVRGDAREPTSDAAPGQGTVKARLLVLLNEPTTDTKKDLRAALDRSEALQSHQRKAVLKSLIPVLSYPVADETQLLSSEARFQFDADLVYYEWGFGGVGLWPVAAAGRGASDELQALVFENFRDDTPWWKEQKKPVRALCGWVCPNRVWWRLALNVLLLTGVVSIGLFLWNCKVRSWGGWGYVAGLIVGGVVTAIVYGVLLTCDPALYFLKRGNATLFVVLAAALSGSLFLALKLKRKVAKP